MGDRIKEVICKSQRRVHKGTNTENLLGKVTNESQDRHIRFYSKSMFATET